MDPVDDSTPRGSVDPVDDSTARRPADPVDDTTARRPADPVHDSTSQPTTSGATGKGRRLSVGQPGLSLGQRGLAVGQRGLAALSALAVVLLIGSLLGGGDAGATASAGTTAQRESITVIGTGEVTGTPDVLRVDFAVEATADTVGQALDRANKALDAMRTTLRRAGVKPADLQTADLAVTPQYSNDGRDVVGYQASQRLTATYRDLGSAGASISDAVEAGGDAARVQGLRFDLEGDAAVLADARKAAVADAKAKAQLYATAAGRDVGQVVRIEEQETSSEPIPYAARDSAAGAEVADVPTEAGSQVVSVSVVVEYAFA